MENIYFLTVFHSTERIAKHLIVAAERYAHIVVAIAAKNGTRSQKYTTLIKQLVTQLFGDWFAATFAAPSYYLSPKEQSRLPVIYPSSHSLQYGTSHHSSAGIDLIHLFIPTARKHKSLCCCYLYWPKHTRIHIALYPKNPLYKF